MPTPIVHLCVAKKLLEFIDVSDKSMFFTGSIAPDAFYLKPTYYDLDGFHVRHKKAHFPNFDFALWKLSVRDFVAHYSTHENRDFYLGYGVHILTDVLWKETVFGAFRREFSPDDFPHSERRKIFYNDARIFDYELYVIYDLHSDVWDSLSSCTKIGFSGIVSANEVYSWSKYTITLFDNYEANSSNIIYFFTNEKLLNFITNSASEISNLLGVES
jgi:hypothetical protein